MSARWLLFIVTFSGSCSLQAYELATHGALTQKAYERSVLRNPQAGPALLKDLGINPAVPKPFGDSYFDIWAVNAYPREAQEFEGAIIDGELKVEPLSIQGWLMRGAIREDDVPARYGENPQDDPYGNFLRVLNHFYDPILDRSLTIDVTSLPGGTYAGGLKSPDWALGVQDAFVEPGIPNYNRRNHFTVLDAREAMFRALTGKDAYGIERAGTKAERDRYWATTFRALGDVVHLVQDAGQPQHTRNDPHAGAFFDDGQDPVLSRTDLLGGHKSVYEAYIEARATGRNFKTLDFVTRTQAIDLPVQPLVYEGSPAYPIPRFTDYTSFFSTRHRNNDVSSRTGLADYSNRGFFSAGKNLGHNEYDFPSNQPNDYLRFSLSVNWLNSALSPLDRNARVEMLLHDVPDPVAGDARNVPLTTYGAWDQFLTAKGEAPAYTLTRINYDRMADLLIPRAVAYSAGLIDYFFRGKVAAEDVGFSQEGTTLRVKNAIDTDRNPHLKEEVMRSGGKLAVAYDYELNGEQIVGSSDLVSLMQDLKPGDVSDTPYAFRVPTIPKGAMNIKHRLVFRGQLGQEIDGVAAGDLTPVSGFVVHPNYVPEDGLLGSRNLYNASGDWRLSYKAGLMAGNTDWKGWYVNGKPTKVLTYSGPPSRYFEDYWYDSQGYGHLFIPFDSAIYQNGERFAVAPAGVMAAAITKDSQGKVWLVALCQSGTSDVVYRRSYKKSDSPALYHEAANPDGWREIGRLNSEAGDRPAGTPWFFNGAGTEAQTMRMWVDPADPYHYTQIKRLKVVITDAATATFENLGNLGGYSTAGQCTGGYDSDGGGSVTTAGRTTGEYIIAVDYKDGREVFAKVAADGFYNYATTVMVSKETDSQGNVVKKTGYRNTTGDFHHTESLKWDGPDIPVFVLSHGLSSAYGNDPLTYHSNYTDYYRWNYATYHLDLRYDLYSYSHQTNDQMIMEELVESGQVRRVREGQGLDATYVVSALAPEQRVFYQATPFYREETASPYLELFGTPGDCTPPAPGHYWKPNFMDFTGDRYGGIHGSWVVDTEGSLLVSQGYYSEASYTRHDGFNYFTGGDPKKIIPPGKEGARYYPMGVIR